MENETQRAQELDLSNEEMAFYDAVALNFINLYTEAFLRDLMHDFVQTLKCNLKVDWPEQHRQDAHAAVRIVIKRVLKRYKVREEDLEPFLGSILVQVDAQYSDWPVWEYELAMNQGNEGI